VNGLSINGSEHYTITYQPTDVLLTVASGALPAVVPGAVSTTAAPDSLAYAPAAHSPEAEFVHIAGSDPRERLAAILREFNTENSDGGERISAGNNMGRVMPRLEQIRKMELLKAPGRVYR
jgi:hypothetical protein